MNQFLKGVIWVCIGIIPFLAWLVADSMFFPFITGKNFMFRVLIEIAFSSWLMLAIRDVNYRLRQSILLYVYLGFMIIIGIADAHGVDSHASFWSNYERMEGYITHMHLFAYFLILFAFLKGEKAWTRMMGLFVAANVPVLIEGFMQLLGRPEFFFAKVASYLHTATSTPNLQQTFHDVYSVHMSDSLRLDSSLGNAAYYGIYTLFNFIFAAMLIMKADKFKSKEEKYNFRLFLHKLKFDFRGVISLITLIVSALLVLSSAWAQSVGNTNLSTVVYYVGMLAVLTSVYYFAKGYNAGLIGRGTLSIIAVMNLVQLYYTQTRGSYLGLVGGVMVAVALTIAFKIKRKFDKKIANSILASASFVGTLLVIIFIAWQALSLTANYITSHKDSKLVQSNVFLNRLATINIINPIHGFQLVQDETLTYKDLDKYFGDITIVSRFLNAKIAVQGWHDRPWFGYGQENYKNVFDKYFDPRMYSQEAWFDRTHNVFFDWLVAGGALGLAFYLALYLTPYYIMWLGKNKNKFSLMEKSAISGLLVAYFIHNIFVFDNLISYILFFMVLAYVARRSVDVENLKIEEYSSKNVDNAHLKINKNVERVLMTIIPLTLIAVLYTANWKPFASNLSISKGLQYKQVAQIIASQGNDPTAAIKGTSDVFEYAIGDNNFGKQEALEQYVTAAPEIISIQVSKKELEQSINDAKIKLVSNAFSMMQSYSASNTMPARSLTIYAGALAGLRLYDQSLIVIDKAIAEAPKKQILLNFKAQLLSMLNRKDEAYQTVKKSYLLDVTFKASEDLFFQLAGESKNGKDFESTMKVVKNVSSLPYDDKYVAIYVESKMYPEATKMINEAKKLSLGDATTTNKLNKMLTEMYKSMSTK